jgi:Bacterial HORMA domain family 1
VSTYTVTETGARELAGRVASDLRQFSLHYGVPALSEISDYMEELEALLRRGYVSTYSFGYRRNGSWKMAYHYQVARGQLTGGMPGGIVPNVDVSGATYFNYMTYSDDWWQLTAAQREAFRSTLRIERVNADEPSYAGGVWVETRAYGVGGTELRRRLFKR